jgi:hypothetical protein
MPSRPLVSALFFLTLGAPRIYAQTFEQPTNAYLSELEKKNASVFVAQCDVTIKAKKGAEKTSCRASLLIDVNTQKGLLIESEANVVVNLAAVGFNQNGLALGETNGGVYSYARVTGLIKELSHSRFILLSPFKKTTFHGLYVTQRCHSNVE